MRPLISILMTCYNAQPYIKKAIDSVLEQTYENWELLVADDCSTDSTRNIIDGYDDHRIRVFHNQNNLHYLRTRNNLVEKVTGDYITLLDSDDWIVPHRLERLLKEFQQNPKLGMCGSFVSYVNVKGDPIDMVDSKPTTNEEIRQRIAIDSVFTGSTIMVKTSIWKSIGGYRDFFNSFGYEDYDLTSRIVEKYPAINISEPLYIYRQYPESTSKKDLLYNPFKLHGAKLVQLFISERREFGKDSLDRGDYPKIINFVLNLNRPFVDDPSRIYRHFMWSYLNRRILGKALISSLIALRIKPFSWANWKAIGLYVLICLRIIKN